MRRGKILIVYGVLTTALGTGAARGEVEAEAGTADVGVEKIFHYEEGSEVVNELGGRGVSLAEIWPGLYAVGYYGYFGANFTLFDETGRVTREYVLDKERPETSGTFFPAADGGYFLNTWGNAGGFEYRGDMLERTYSHRDGEELWHSSGPESTGHVAVSPDGERVVYIQSGGMFPQPDSKIIFKNAAGLTIAEHTIPYLGEYSNFTVDGDYFLVSESRRSSRGEDCGTAVFDKDGELLFFLDPLFSPGIRWGRSKAAMGGGRGYLYQIGYKLEGLGFNTIPQFDLGRLLQVYDSSGKKLREVKVSKREWGAGLSADGRLIAYVPAEPGDEFAVAELASGDLIRRFPFNTVGPKFPTITLSNGGERVCVSNTSSGSSWAGVLSEQGTIIESEADKLGSFHLSSDGNHVVFCGARTLAVFEINLASN
jgi:hypothetical protein